MKRILLLVLAFTAAIGSLSAQNYIVVNSEKRAATGYSESG